MKKNILLLAATIVAGITMLAIKPLLAQDATPAAQPAPAAPPVAAPPMRQGLPPGGFPGQGMRGRPGGSYFITIRYLRMAKTELERSTDDFNGHRQSAIDAVDKALAELTVVQQLAQAKAIATRNAAAQSAQAPGNGAVPAPVPNQQTPPPTAPTPNVPPTQSQ